MPSALAAWGRLPTRVCLRRVGSASLLSAFGQPRSARPSRRHANGLHRKNAPNTARRDATLPGIVLSGAPTLLSGMLAQVPVGTSVKRHAPLRLSGGARQRASSRLRSVAAHISRYRGTLLHLGGSAPPIPLGGLRPPLLALRAITVLLWRLCLQTSAALRRRASGWRFSKASILHAPPPWDAPIGRLGVRLPYPSQWNAIQSVSVPGGNQRHSRCTPHSHAASRARTAESPHRSRPFPTQTLGIPLIQTSAKTLPPNTSR